MQRTCPVMCPVAPACELVYFKPVCPCPVTVVVEPAP